MNKGYADERSFEKFGLNAKQTFHEVHPFKVIEPTLPENTVRHFSNLLTAIHSVALCGNKLAAVFIAGVPAYSYRSCRWHYADHFRCLRSNGAGAVN